MKDKDIIERIKAATVVRREDIARAKDYVLKSPATVVLQIVNQWARENVAEPPDEINRHAANLEEELSTVGQTIGHQLSMIRAVCELVVSGDLVHAGSSVEWKPRLPSMRDGGYVGKIDSPAADSFLEQCAAAHPNVISRPRSIEGFSTDPDIFLAGVSVATLHPGVAEAVEQSLMCFRRGLYLPSIAMLAAAVEANWHECGGTVHRETGDAALVKAMSDPLVGFGKLVSVIRGAIATAKGKALLEKARVSAIDVAGAEVWTTVLREKRNALHWKKGRGFVAEHAEAATLLMAAPLHFATLEAIRHA